MKYRANVELRGGLWELLFGAAFFAVRRGGDDNFGVRAAPAVGKDIQALNERKGSYRFVGL